MRLREKQVPIFDPDRQPGKQASTRAQHRAKYLGMTPEQMCRSMDERELASNARKGGIAAIAEVERRAAESAQNT